MFILLNLLQRLHCELPDAIIRQIPNCGHLPHLERPDSTIKLIVEFVQRESKTLSQCVAQVWRLKISWWYIELIKNAPSLFRGR